MRKTEKRELYVYVWAGDGGRVGGFEMMRACVRVCVRAMTRKKGDQPSVCVCVRCAKGEEKRCVIFRHEVFLLSNTHTHTLYPRHACTFRGERKGERYRAAAAEIITMMMTFMAMSYLVHT